MIAQNTDLSFKMASNGLNLQLLDLPDEILIAVMSHLNVDSLLKAKLVCKHFDDIADQFLYEDAKILRGREAVALAAALMKRPVRRNWVRSLLVSTKFGEDSGLSRLPPCLEYMRNLETLRLETPDCNNRQPEERTSWIRLQNMYESIFEQSSLLVPRAVERKLPHLRECTLHFVDGSVELYSLTKYASIFLHPGLRSLTISCASTDLPERLSEAMGNPKDLARSTNLEHLLLEECDIHAPSLAYLLSFPRRLKSLRFSEGVRYDGLFRTGSRRMHGNVRPHHLMEALTASCADSLEFLSLTLGYRRHQSQSINDPGQHLDITRMTRLRSLEVDNTTLQLIRPRPHCDHRTWLRLPSSLETLKVSHIKLSVHLPFETRREPYIPLETCLVKEKAKHGVPKLKTIIYSYEFSDDEDEYNEIDDFLLLGVLPNPPNAAGVGDANAAPGDNNPANMPNVPIHPPQPPVANGHIPAQFANNLNAVNPGNLNPAQQMLRQHWFMQAYRTQYQHRQAHREFTHLEMNKLALLDILNNDLLPQYRQHHVELVVDMVKLPRGFIPPYLYPEDKPTTHTSWWSSSHAKETEAYKREFRHAREVRIFERNMREERERRRREEELQELRRRIGRGEDFSAPGVPIMLTRESRRLLQTSVFDLNPINDEDEEEGDEDNDEGSEDSDEEVDTGESDYSDDNDIDSTDEDESDIHDNEDGIDHNFNRIDDQDFIPPLVSDAGIELAEGDDGHTISVLVAGEPIQLTTGPNNVLASSRTPRAGDESDEDYNFVDAPVHWEDEH